MEEQTVTITLEEYKQLRDILEDYQRLLGEYNLLTYAYNLQNPPEQKVKKKNPIGFDMSRKG